MRELWQKSGWLLLMAAVVAAFSFVLSKVRGEPLPAEPLALAPLGATVVGRADVGAVLSSHLWNALLEDDRPPGGVRRIERACGYDPLAQVDEVVVFAFDGRPFEHTGFVARGEAMRGADNRRRLVDCVRSVLSNQGGEMRQVEVAGIPAVASASGRSHAAFVGEDGVVGGDREVVERTVRVLQGRSPSAVGDEELRGLWERVSGDVVAVARLPEGWSPALERMAHRLGGGFEALASVRVLGVGVHLRRGLSLGAVAKTETPQDAQRLEAAVRAPIEELLEQPLARGTELGRLLRRVSVEAQGRQAVLTLSMSDAQVDAVLELWRSLERRGADRPREPERADD